MKPSPAAKQPDEPQPSTVGKPPIEPTASRTPEEGSGLPLPHERDQSTGSADGGPDPAIEQARRDLQSGQVDTDLRATPGLDAERRDELLRRGRR